MVLEEDSSRDKLSAFKEAFTPLEGETRPTGTARFQVVSGEISIFDPHYDVPFGLNHRTTDSLLGDLASSTQDESPILVFKRGVLVLLYEDTSFNVYKEGDNITLKDKEMDEEGQQGMRAEEPLFEVSVDIAMVVIGDTRAFGMSETNMNPDSNVATLQIQNGIYECTVTSSPESPPDPYYEETISEIKIVKIPEGN